VKITLDGSPQGRTAFFTTPYLTGGPGGEKDWKGEPTFPQELANQMVKKVYDLKVPLILHCNGDAAIDAFLTAYEFARAEDFSRPWNVTTIHTQFLRKDIKVVETIKGGVTIYPAPAGGEKALVKAPQESGKTYTWRTHVCDMAGVNQAAHKEWTLTALNGEKIDVAKPPTMKFAHGKLSIFGGINRLSGSYALVDGGVVMGKLVSTKMAGPPALMELERNFAKTLATVDGFDVSGNELTLSSDGAVVATFRSGE
jgi:heat shock protein HslJ